MRPVAFIALILLLVSLGLKQELASRRSEVATEAPTPEKRAHSVRLFSTAWKRATPELGSNRIYHGFLIDSVLYNTENRGTGLFLMELPASGGVSPMLHFAIQRQRSDINLLNQYLDQVELDSVLLLASHTSIGIRKAAPEPYREAARAVFNRIGAKTDPTHADTQSFTYICIKTESGFKAISEVYSESTGVSLAYLIPADRSELHDLVPEHLFDDRRLLELSRDTAVSDRFTSTDAVPFQQVRFPALTAQVSESESAKVSWDLDPNFRAAGRKHPFLFTARIGSSWVNNGKMYGIRFTLIVDDTWVADRVIPRESGYSARWLNWEQTLPDLETMKRITVRAEWIGEGPGSVQVALSRPTLVGGHQKQL